MPDFPAQKRERLRWIVDVVRVHQDDVGWILINIAYDPPIPRAIRVVKEILMSMHKQDRDALLQEGGILTSEQIELLK